MTPEPTRLFRLLYASRIAPAVEADLEPALRDILAASVRNNRAEKICGLLVAARGWFVQALEGPERAVEQRFDVIRHDQRHTAFTVIHWGHVTERAFAQWSMCAQGLSPTDAAIIATLGHKTKFDPSTWSEAVAMRLLRTVSDIHARSLAEDYARAEAEAA